MPIGVKASVSPIGNVKRPVAVAIGVYFALCHLRGHQGVITSLNDSKHGTGSLHYYDEAFDGRTKHLKPEDRDWLFREMKSILEPCGFDVVLENAGGTNEHLHCEFQPKPGEKFIEVVP
jgi:hypothetical protein